MQEDIYCPFCGSVMSAGNRLYRKPVYTVDEDEKFFDVKCAVRCDKCAYAAWYERSYEKKGGLYKIAFDDMSDDTGFLEE